MLWTLTSDVSAAEVGEIGPTDMDLIEFLGGWETEDGEWVDPELFDLVFAEDVAEIEAIEMEGDAAQDPKTQDTVSKEETGEEDDGMRKEEK